MREISRALIVSGLILVAAGLLLAFAGKIPFIGRLPGDIYIRKKNFTFFFPVTTGILISIILSFIFRLWSRR